MSDAPVIAFMSRADLTAQRTVDEQRAYEDGAHAEALAMLDKAMIIIAAEGKVASLAIAIAFDDGRVGYLTPEVGNKIHQLVGALAEAQFTIHLRNRGM